MKRNPRWWRRFGVRVAVLVLAALPARAEYPKKPIKLVVGYAVGGPADSAARFLAQAVSKRLGRSVVVENRPGAGGSVAAASVARAPADGYTLLYATSDLVLYPALNPEAAFDPVRDFEPVVGTTRRPLVLVVTPGLGARSVEDLIAYAKANPGKLNFESSGVGSVEHLAGEVFQARTGVKLSHVPYKGSAPAILDLLSGQVQLGFEVPTGVIGHIQTGKLAGLVVTSPERLKSLPHIPSVREVGLPDMELRVPWAGIFAPAGTPPDRITRLNAEFARARDSKEAVDSPVFAESQSMTGTPAALKAMVLAELARWKGIVKAAGIRLE